MFAIHPKSMVEKKIDVKIQVSPKQRTTSNISR